MENPTNPKSEGTTPTPHPTDAAACRMFRSLISEAHEANYERSKSADTDEELECIENESQALDQLNAWLNAKEALNGRFDLSAVPLTELAEALAMRTKTESPDMKSRNMIALDFACAVRNVGFYAQVWISEDARERTPEGNEPLTDEEIEDIFHRMARDDDRSMEANADLLDELIGDALDLRDNKGEDVK